MKRLIMFTTLLLLAVTAPVHAGDARSNGSQEKARAGMLIQRLHAIQDMDIKSMSPSQRSELRSEVKNIRHELREVAGGVYLSVGAIIIIILLLILLL